MVRSLHASDVHATPHTSSDAEEAVLHGEVNGPLHDEWKEPKNLDAPPARAGYVQRWVRVDDRSGKDMLNMNNKLREGWRPRKLEDVPEEYRNFPVMKHASLGDVLYVGGCILCEMPRQLADSRNRQVKARIARQNRAVETDADAASRAGTAAGMSPIVRDETIRTSHRAPVIQGD
jgi:hypothetical protein